MVITPSVGSGAGFIRIKLIKQNLKKRRDNYYEQSKFKKDN